MKEERVMKIIWNMISNLFVVVVVAAMIMMLMMVLR